MATEYNLIDKMWKGKPKMTLNPIYIHDIKYAGESAINKLEKVALRSFSDDYLILQQLDEIAWLLNLRGNDILHNPLFSSYMIIQFKNGKYLKGRLFIHLEKVTKEVAQYLQQLRITLDNYDNFYRQVSQLQGKLNVSNANCVLSFIALNTGNDVRAGCNPIMEMKAIKNSVQHEGIQNCLIRDGAALAQFYGWLEKEIQEKKNTDLTEYTVTKVLSKLRSELDLNKGNAFPCISAFGPNANQIHYFPSEKTALKIDESNMYLLDSGGQYLDGTVDCTRTVHFGNPTDNQKDKYTRVLLGNLSVERIKWPASKMIKCEDIEILARTWLQFLGIRCEYGDNGHGVGHFSGVHETPPIPWQPYLPGMTITNEPGYYEKGKFGIRIENQMVILQGKDGLIGFKNQTRVPYSKNLLDFSLLSRQDIEYINDYHAQCLKDVGVILNKHNWKLGLNWLEKYCKPIDMNVLKN